MDTLDYGEINRLMTERRVHMDKAKMRFLETDHVESDFSDAEEKTERAAGLIETLVALQPDDAHAVVALAKDYFAAFPKDREAFLRNLRALLEGIQ